MAFDNWLKKLKEHQVTDLLWSILDSLSDEAQAELVETLADQLNDKGYEWQ